jgi:DNA primase
MKKHRLLYKRKRLKSSGIYKQSDINLVKYNLPFIEVISDFVVLKKTGSDAAGRCPFCKTITENDKHFRVSERKKIYKCFECGSSGNNSLNFIMKYYDIPFDEGIRFVDRQYTKTGIRPEKYRPVKQLAHTDDSLPF